MFCFFDVLLLHDRITFRPDPETCENTGEIFTPWSKKFNSFDYIRKRLFYWTFRLASSNLFVHLKKKNKSSLYLVWFLFQNRHLKMIKLFSLKQQKKDGETAGKSSNQKRASAAQLRITKGINKWDEFFIKVIFSPRTLSFRVCLTGLLCIFSYDHDELNDSKI